MRRRPLKSRPLTAPELAEAAVLGDVAALLVILGWFLPLSGLFIAASVVPFAALVVRHRARALAVGAASACGVGFLILGLGLALNLAAAAGCGFVVGTGLKRRWGRVRTAGYGLAVGWTALAGLSVATLAALPGSRKLTLQQIEITWRAARRLLSRVGLGSTAHSGDVAISWLVHHWWFFVPAAELPVVIGAVVLTYGPALGVIARLNAALRPGAGTNEPRTHTALADGATAPPGPVPITLDQVSFRYAGASTNALTQVSLEVPIRAFVAILGPNGSGKTTLARILAGATPSEGAVTRPGSASLGVMGGSALIHQRPESQVLGVRVWEDVVWGLPQEVAVNVPDLLGRVGLEGFEERETSDLSGGELQRLAIAAALARRPTLLISDESTSMLDPLGRRQVVEVLHGLVSKQGTTVVHITHRREEAEHAAILVTMSGGRAVTRRVSDRSPEGTAP